jgi:MoCo/4Fe-4S cofactor protein with predicted Tat translocation signal
MENNNKRYWRGLEELSNDVEFVKNAEKEFADYQPIMEIGEGSNRRDFLKLLGFSVAAVSVAACNTAPIKKAIPYLNKPAELDPSIPNYYASTFFEDGDYASVLVKTREGRPIKIEGNNLSSISGGKTSAKAQASVLGLYDLERYKAFQEKGKEIEMKDADAKISALLENANNIRIVSSTIISPSTKSAVADFKAKFKGAEHIMYDANSAYGILQANKDSFGVEMIPSYTFDKADVIVSFACDFLGTWISPVEFSRQYGKTRKLGKDKKQMSRHYQFESGMSMTGANADVRVQTKPSQLALAVVALYQKLNGGGKHKDENIDKALDKAVKDLQNAQGKSLVVSGSNDPAIQTLVNAINQKLGNYGNTIDVTVPCNLRQGNDKAMNTLIDEIKGGSIDTVIFYGANPVYNHPRGKELVEALGKVKTKISFASQPDETSVLCDFICPDHNFLESWGDAEPKKGYFSLQQPTITPIFKTRQAQESLLVWSGAKTQNFYEYVRGYWNKNLFKTQNTFKTFEEFWNTSLHDGVFSTKADVKPVEEKKTDPKDEKKPVDDKPTKPAGTFNADVDGAISAVNQTYKEGGIELNLYEKVSLGWGAQANNPWLQELPDPVSRACWDNYLCVSKKYADDNGLSQGTFVKVQAKGFSFEIPVLIQPGQAKDSVSIAIGYGREVSGKVGKTKDNKPIGTNVFPLAQHNFIGGVTISKSETYPTEIAQVQTHHTIMGRDIIQEATLGEYQKKADAGRNIIKIHTPDGPKKPTDITLWKGHKYPNHSWSMTIDLNSCIGCGACVVACQVENNVPVVGKKEVLMRREMHWIRIDRYYSSDAELKDLSGLEEASENPDVVFMPMMCQHCNNAPCETVCPVLATTHSTEGLNQMAYNRCIGTRYCANNCPYKVRRFNWFHYAEDTRFTDVNPTQTSDLGRMVLNPDVTVRSRGVMEKCSLCVQRIQAGKLEAKKEKRHVKDGDIQTACSQVCPTDAILFGDLNDSESQIAKLTAEEYDKRAYHVLEEINVKAQVAYLTKIRNNDKVKAKPGHGGGHDEHKAHKEGEEKKEAH